MFQFTFGNFLIAALASSFPYAAAIPAPMPVVTTLAVPALVFNPDSSPLPAVVLGVDKEGHTTYAINQIGIMSDALTTQTIPFTATLVAGASYASYTLSISAPGIRLADGFDCSLDQNKNEAVCSEFLFDTKGSTMAVATIPSLTGLVVDVVSTAAPQGGNGKPNSAAGQRGLASFTMLRGVMMMGLVFGAGWVM
ncbi:hypothetical protein R3P38DRAFT_3431742 [Favolaschia claudopus]|uniref:Uncharacterized protein n=1 Tax=Favolaschia claudopus TaxID=2862362 RepID=A0AAW0CYH8_9AGAR